MEQIDERKVVKVWDWETRVLHWTNMVLIVSLILLILGKEGMEMLGVERALRAPVKRLHAYVGHVFAVTFLLRMIWAFIGNKYARWGDILPLSGEKWRAMGQNIKWYLGGFRGAPAHVVGHDPLASLFYIALFIVLASQVITGIILSGIDLHTFPGVLFIGGMNGAALEALEEALKEVHEFGLWFMMFFICAHLGGLVAHEIKEGNGLLSSMIHGKKYFKKD